MRLQEIIVNESTVAGGIATVATPLGGVQRRDNVGQGVYTTKGPYANSVGQPKKKSKKSLKESNEAMDHLIMSMAHELDDDFGQDPSTVAIIAQKLKLPKERIRAVLQNMDSESLHEGRMKEIDAAIRDGLTAGRPAQEIASELGIPLDWVTDYKFQDRDDVPANMFGTPVDRERHGMNEQGVSEGQTRKAMQRTQKKDPDYCDACDRPNNRCVCESLVQEAQAVSATTVADAIFRAIKRDYADQGFTWSGDIYDFWEFLDEYEGSRFVDQYWALSQRDQRAVFAAVKQAIKQHFSSGDDVADARGRGLMTRMREQGVSEGVNVKQIKKDIDSGMSLDAVIGKHANRRTTNTDEIRRVIQQHAWEKRKNKTKEQGVQEGYPYGQHKPKKGECPECGTVGGHEDDCSRHPDNKKPGVSEARYFKTSYGWAGGQNPKTGKKYKHPEQIKIDREARKKQQSQEKSQDPAHWNFGSGVVAEHSAPNQTKSRIK